MRRGGERQQQISFFFKTRRSAEAARKYAPPGAPWAPFALSAMFDAYGNASKRRYRSTQTDSTAPTRVFVFFFFYALLGNTMLSAFSRRTSASDISDSLIVSAGMKRIVSVDFANDSNKGNKETDKQSAKRSQCEQASQAASKTSAHEQGVFADRRCPHS